MEEKSGKGIKAEDGRSGRSEGRNINFQEEFKQSFNKALFYQKMAETSLAYLDKMNPSKEVLPELNNLDDNQAKDIKEALSADMQEWLDMWRAVLNEGKSLPVDIIGLASDLARRDRQRLK